MAKRIGLDIAAPSRVVLVVKKGGSTMPQKRPGTRPGFLGVLVRAVKNT